MTTKKRTKKTSNLITSPAEFLNKKRSARGIRKYRLPDLEDFLEKQEIKIVRVEKSDKAVELPPKELPRVVALDSGRISRDANNNYYMLGDCEGDEAPLKIILDMRTLKNMQQFFGDGGGKESSNKSLFRRLLDALS